MLTDFTNFANNMNAILAKYPMIAHASKNRPMTFNELAYVLRFEEKDYCIQAKPTNWFCFSVQECFFSIDQLSKSVTRVELADGDTTLVVTLTD